MLGRSREGEERDATAARGEWGAAEIGGGVEAGAAARGGLRLRRRGPGRLAEGQQVLKRVGGEERAGGGRGKWGTRWPPRNILWGQRA